MEEIEERRRTGRTTGRWTGLERERPTMEGDSGLRNMALLLEAFTGVCVFHYNHPGNGNWGE